ncbi:hypothetical protein [Methanogenium sp. MK-MG]|uniref:hypothetical protein n=1 Tax=Methanogenium sp. MK-MG TaxID=2599926 RepID=UPI0013EADEB8|nr:hypothetical protein [Methanogenium sp. MK-MG]KAF1076402.1 hypothetical protein MKMG_01508 [Methanogenium sp. MK-MG]
MVSIRRNPQAEETTFGAGHKLFVEGDNENSIDPIILRRLLNDTITVRPLGPSTHIRSAAKSLHWDHPTYYFLIDRDHFDDEMVEACWKRFPDPEQDNLLIWRLRELENYFLDPAFLARSEFCTVSQERLESEILAVAQRRLFMETANLALIKIREDLKENWIKIFKNPDEFSDRDETIERLIEALHAKEFTKKVWDTLKRDEIIHLFEHYSHEISGGSGKISFENPVWLKYIKGKPVLSSVIGKPSFFEVKDREGNSISGRDKINIICDRLLMDRDVKKPDDFIQLKRLIEDRV